jgi:hypothetical protein
LQPRHSDGLGLPDAANDFFRRALAEQLSSADVFRITITSFLDAYNFDVRRLMKCCIHHVLPSGHVIPFCAYNVLYREGHVVLPALKQLDKNVCPTSKGEATKRALPMAEAVLSHGETERVLLGRERAKV